jgi:hypothetical protein
MVLWTLNWYIRKLLVLYLSSPTRVSADVLGDGMDMRAITPFCKRNDNCCAAGKEDSVCYSRRLRGSRFAGAQLILGVRGPIAFLQHDLALHSKDLWKIPSQERVYAVDDSQ